MFIVCTALNKTMHIVVVIFSIILMNFYCSVVTIVMDNIGNKNNAFLMFKNHCHCFVTDTIGTRSIL